MIRSNSVNSGDVISQSISSGTSVAPDSVIDIVLSSGQPQVVSQPINASNNSGSSGGGGGSHSLMFLLLLCLLVNFKRRGYDK